MKLSIFALVFLVIFIFQDVSGSCYRYLRWKITKNAFLTQSLMQVANFNLFDSSSPIDISSASVTNPSGSSPGGEGTANLVDANINTKWLDLNFKTVGSSTIIIDLKTYVQFTHYSWTTANDSPNRDPKQWTLEGSNDNSLWTLLHSATAYTAISGKARFTLQTKFLTGLNCITGKTYDNSANCAFCSTFTGMTNCQTCCTNSICMTCSSTNYAINANDKCSLCTTFATTIPNCQTCSSNTTCLTCSSTNYAIDTNAKCPLCASFPGMTNCQTCSSNVTCLTCSSTDYAIDANAKCALCASFPGMTNCQTCSSNTTCLTCISTDYAIDANAKCVLCASFPGMTNCQTCSNNVTCLTCISTDYAIDVNAKCPLCASIPGMTNCKTCSSNVTCLTCVIGYGLDTNGLCIGCQILTGVTYCNTCSNVPACLSCFPTDYAIDTAAQCALCTSFPGMTNCQTCSNNVTCLTCISTDYAIDVNAKCPLCASFPGMTNCQTCFNNLTCLTCSSTDYAIDVNAKCPLCASFPGMTNCKTCSNNVTCLTCISTDYAIDVNSKCPLCASFTGMTNCKTCSNNLTCLTCSSTDYAIDANAKCDICASFPGMTNCQTCSNNVTCLTCSTTDYAIDANAKCALCASFAGMTNCQTCSSNVTCLTCVIGYGLDTNGLCIGCQILTGVTYCNTCSNVPACLSCFPTDYAIDTAAQCALCASFPGMTNCQTCSNNVTCLTCISTDYAIDVNAKCPLCASFPGMTNCQTCFNNLTCLTCSSTDYAIDVNAKCPLCASFPGMTNCKTCSNNVTCLTCISTDYAIDANAKCPLCASFSGMTNCKTCSSNTTCLTCISTDYAIDSNAKCPLCASFTGMTYCQTCFNNLTCLTCLSNDYSLDVNAKCSLCSTFAGMTNCQTCSSDTTCLTCISNDYSLDVNAKCSLCSKFAGMTNCKTCSSNTTCLTCSSTDYAINFNGKCSFCLTFAGMAKCQTCSSNTTCLTCSQFYFLESNQCQKCEDKISNCLKCQSSTKCTQCTLDFSLSSDQTACLCLKGKIVSSTCSTVPGCIASFLIKQATVCFACDVQNHWVIAQAQNVIKCVCQKGFYYNKVDDICEERCGDSVRVDLEKCDDGNLINGDGCSNLCKVQADFECKDNSVSKSVCVYGGNVLITLDYILKVDNENKAQMYFKIEPPLLFHQVNWEETIKFTFSTKSRVQVLSFSYSNGNLITTLAYSEDIEQKICICDIKFDESVVLSSPKPLTFPMEGRNAKLIYQNESLIQNNKMVSLASFCLGIAALFCFIVSTYFHKLIGLETLQFIQMLYFLRIFESESFPLTVPGLNSLKYSNGYNEIIIPGQDLSPNFGDIPKVFLKIELQIYYLQNCNLMLIPIFLATLAYVFYLIRSARAYSRYIETNQIHLKDKFIHYRKKVNLIYDNFIFSYSLSLLYLTVFQMLVYKSSNLSGQTKAHQMYINASFGLSLVIIFYIFTIFVSQTLQGLKSYYEALNKKQNDLRKNDTEINEDDKGYHPLYVSFYLLYQFLIVILMNTVLFKFDSFSEILACLTFIYLIAFFLWKPYVMRIHFYANIFNQLIVFVFLIFQILGKRNLLSENSKPFILYSVISLILVALILQICRLYIHKQTKKSKFKLEQKLENQNDAKKTQAFNLSLLNNPYILKTKEQKFLNEKGCTKLTSNVNQNLAILQKEMLRQRLRLQNQIKGDNVQKPKKLQSQLQQSEIDSLKKIKDLIKKGMKYHKQWIIRQEA